MKMVKCSPKDGLSILIVKLPKFFRGFQMKDDNGLYFKSGDFLQLPKEDRYEIMGVQKDLTEAECEKIVQYKVVGSCTIWGLDYITEKFGLTCKTSLKTFFESKQLDTKEDFLILKVI